MKLVWFQLVHWISRGQRTKTGWGDRETHNRGLLYHSCSIMWLFLLQFSCYKTGGPGAAFGLQTLEVINMLLPWDLPQEINISDGFFFFFLTKPRKLIIAMSGKEKKWKLIQCDPLWTREKEQKMIHNWKHELSELFEDLLNKHVRQVINNDNRQ